ncbi:hypothetical protein AURDEDRAFT_173379 [Auricularia subglabra TFB-10046 SS5]|uniref:Uncharacterized protein n=1 Tax=Auricularia subglabra (strain TFB-10046 / SS5) TaxID=717982 RepID=J0DAP8_AURST|nr:hypothetical protein AURDEDRAFT_173379 [Auricularia subglabra TFB-10046 SS5]
MVDTELVDIKSGSMSSEGVPVRVSSPPPARMRVPPEGDIHISFDMTIPGTRLLRGQLRTVRRILLATLVVTVLNLVSLFLRVLAAVLRGVVAPAIRHWLVRTLIFFAIVFWPSDTIQRVATTPEARRFVEFCRGWQTGAVRL